MSVNSVVTAYTTTLVVLLHAFNNKAKSLDDVKQSIRDEWPDAIIYCPELSLQWFSLADPNQIICNLISEISEIDRKRTLDQNEIKRIIFVGHSFGAVLARKLYVVACGETQQAPFENVYKKKFGDELIPAQVWSKKVDRVILLAGLNRGWRVTHHLSLFRAIFWSIGLVGARVFNLFTRKALAITQIKKGAEFITQLRVQWIHMRLQYSESGKSKSGGALTAQLLGSVDDMVSPNDSIDLVSGGDFIYLDVPYSGHRDVVDFSDKKYGSERKSIFNLALTGEEEELKKLSLLPADEKVAAINENVEQLVFVIHGIRDNGYWTHKVARKIKAKVSNPEAWATETSSYGYFPMLPFLFSFSRRDKVEWLMDQYTEALARYPKAKISYVGHSNGTYLLAKALELYPCCKFENVVFAGSVVTTKFDWSRYIQSKQPRVKAVLNFVATTDWVVAFFPKLFEFLRIQDLGAAGHDGFKQKGDARIYEFKYVSGCHSAAVEEDKWDLIADFIINGRTVLNGDHLRKERQNLLVKALGLFPPLVWIFALFILSIIYYYGIYSIIFPSPKAFRLTREYIHGFLTASYFVALWIVLTRF